MTLVAAAVTRLAAMWGEAPPVTAVVFEHHERAVFEAGGPSGPVVVKVDGSSLCHRRERAVLEAARRHHLPVPAVLEADEASPSLLVLERVDGRPLRFVTDPAPWTAAGRFLRHLHEVAWPPAAGPATWSGRAWGEHFRAWADHEIGTLAARGALPGPVGRAMHAVLRRAFAHLDVTAPRLLHGDCQPDHFLLAAAPARLAGVVDFGDAVLGDPLWDLVVLTLDSPALEGAVRRGYGADDETFDRPDGLPDAYRLIRHLGSASWMHEHGLPDVPDLAAAQRLLAGLGPTAPG